MVDEEKKKEILEKLKRAVINYDEDGAKEAAKEALDADVHGT
jgi:methanogenic corrinoid protein MtbC1